MNNFYNNNNEKEKDKEKTTRRWRRPDTRETGFQREQAAGASAAADLWPESSGESEDQEGSASEAPPIATQGSASEAPPIAPQS